MVSLSRTTATRLSALGLLGVMLAVTVAVFSDVRGPLFNAAVIEDVSITGTVDIDGLPYTYARCDQNKIAQSIKAREAAKDPPNIITDEDAMAQAAAAPTYCCAVRERNEWVQPIANARRANTPEALATIPALKAGLQKFTEDREVAEAFGGKVLEDWLKENCSPRVQCGELDAQAAGGPGGSESSEGVQSPGETVDSCNAAVSWILENSDYSPGSASSASEESASSAEESDSSSSMSNPIFSPLPCYRCVTGCGELYNPSLTQCAPWDGPGTRPTTLGQCIEACQFDPVSQGSRPSFSESSQSASSESSSDSSSSSFEALLCYSCDYESENPQCGPRAYPIDAEHDSCDDYGVYADPDDCSCNASSSSDSSSSDSSSSSSSASSEDEYVYYVAGLKTVDKKFCCIYPTDDPVQGVRCDEKQLSEDACVALVPNAPQGTPAPSGHVQVYNTADECENGNAARGIEPCAWCGDAIVQQNLGEQCDNGDPTTFSLQAFQADIKEVNLKWAAPDGKMNIPSVVANAKAPYVSGLLNPEQGVVEFYEWITAMKASDCIRENAKSCKKAACADADGQKAKADRTYESCAVAFFDDQKNESCPTFFPPLPPFQCTGKGITVKYDDAGNPSFTDAGGAVVNPNNIEAEVDPSACDFMKGYNVRSAVNVKCPPAWFVNPPQANADADGRGSFFDLIAEMLVPRAHAQPAGGGGAAGGGGGVGAGGGACAQSGEKCSPAGYWKVSDDGKGNPLYDPVNGKEGPACFKLTRKDNMTKTGNGLDPYIPAWTETKLDPRTGRNVTINHPTSGNPKDLWDDSCSLNSECESSQCVCQVDLDGDGLINDIPLTRMLIYFDDGSGVAQHTQEVFKDPVSGKYVYPPNTYPGPGWKQKTEPGSCDAPVHYLLPTWQTQLATAQKYKAAFQNAVDGLQGFMDKIFEFDDTSIEAAIPAGIMFSYPDTDVSDGFPLTMKQSDVYPKLQEWQSYATGEKKKWDAEAAKLQSWINNALAWKNKGAGGICKPILKCRNEPACCGGGDAKTTLRCSGGECRLPQPRERTTQRAGNFPLQNQQQPGQGGQMAGQMAGQQGGNPGNNGGGNNGGANNGSGNNGSGNNNGSNGTNATNGTGGSSRRSSASSVRSSARSSTTGGTGGSARSSSASSKDQKQCDFNACAVDMDGVPGPDGVKACADQDADEGTTTVCTNIDKLPCLECRPVSSRSSSSRSSSVSSRNLCGNRVFDEGEECGEPGLSCSFGGTCKDCQCALCGDGFKEGDEQCDDGNNADEDGCSAKCKVEKCGDKVVQKKLGEQCDAGSVCNVNSATSCILDADCRVCKAVSGASAKRCGGGQFGALCNVDADCAGETQIQCVFKDDGKCTVPDCTGTTCTGGCQTTSAVSSRSSSSRSSSERSSSIRSSSSRSSSVRSSSVRSSSVRSSSVRSSANGGGTGGSTRSSSRSSSSERVIVVACVSNLDCDACEQCTNNRCTSIPGCVASSRSSSSRSSSSRSSSARACFNDFDCGTCEDCVNGLCRDDPSCNAQCTSNFDCGTCQQCSNNRCVNIPNCTGDFGVNGTISTIVGVNGTFSTVAGVNGAIGSIGGTTGGTVSICGNGVRERGEVCDDGNQTDDDECTNNCRRPPESECTSPAQCESRICTGGRCTPCSLDEQCPADHRCVAGNCVIAPPFCGNGRLDAGEQCDDGNANDKDACSGDCLFGTGQRCTYDYQCDTGRCVNGVCSRCASDDQCPADLACIDGECLKTVDVAYTPNFCGNGILEPGESCDLGTQNSDKPNAACRPDCSRGRCGDSVLDRPLEACDDGNTVPGDGCNSLCQVEPGAKPVPEPDDLAQIPFQPGQGTQATGGTGGAVGGDIIRPRPPTNGGVQGDSGPATVAIMAAGAAAGTAWVRRKFGKKGK